MHLLWACVYPLTAKCSFPPDLSPFFVSVRSLSFRAQHTFDFVLMRLFPSGRHLEEDLLIPHIPLPSTFLIKSWCCPEPRCVQRRGVCLLRSDEPCLATNLRMFFIFKLFFPSPPNNGDPNEITLETQKVSYIFLIPSNTCKHTLMCQIEFSFRNIKHLNTRNTRKKTWKQFCSLAKSTQLFALCIVVCQV